MKDNSDLLSLSVFPLFFDLRFKDVANNNFFDISAEIFSPLDFTICS